MTERTIRTFAKELAGKFWENPSDWNQPPHSERFRKFWRTANNFIGRNWPTFVPMARELMVATLKDPNVSEPIKQGIYDALLEEHAKNVVTQGTKVGRGSFNLNPEHPGPRERKLFHE